MIGATIEPALHCNAMTVDTARYAEQGFLVIPGFKAPAEIAALRERARRQFETGIFEPLELGGYHLPPSLVTECGYGEGDD